VEPASVAGGVAGAELQGRVSFQLSRVSVQLKTGVIPDPRMPAGVKLFNTRGAPPSLIWQTIMVGRGTGSGCEPNHEAGKKTLCIIVRQDVALFRTKMAGLGW
jgi:hypothetical protein